MIEVIDSEAAARLLDVPLIAMGQVVCDGRLNLYFNLGMNFAKKEVQELSRDQVYLETLRV